MTHTVAGQTAVRRLQAVTIGDQLRLQAEEAMATATTDVLEAGHARRLMDGTVGGALHLATTTTACHCHVGIPPRFLTCK